jgi:hypothetical protein
MNFRFFCAYKLFGKWMYSTCRSSLPLNSVMRQGVSCSSFLRSRTNDSDPLVMNVLPLLILSLKLSYREERLRKASAAPSCVFYEFVKDYEFSISALVNTYHWNLRRNIYNSGTTTKFQMSLVRSSQEGCRTFDGDEKCVKHISRRAWREESLCQWRMPRHGL